MHKSLVALHLFYLFDVSNPDLFESTLWKKGKDNKQFLKRIFLLSRKDFTLRYFIKEDVRFSTSPFSLQCFWAYMGNSQVPFISNLLKSFLNPLIQSKLPKAVISMKDLNAVFQPEKINHAHGLQISYMHDKRTRNLFVYHEKGQVSLSAIVIFYFYFKQINVLPLNLALAVTVVDLACLMGRGKRALHRTSSTRRAP